MANQIQTNNKQIAKNAMALYFRMIVMMLINFFAVRVVLKSLGVVDYGIYNVVGGFVTMFSLVSSSLVSSVSRSLTFELGKGDKERLKQTFSTSLYVLFGLCIILVFLLESVGLWYLENKIVIPSDRLVAAHWCFQLSMITFILQLVNAPYSASIVSHERMDIYAYLTILDAFFKLIVCYAIIHSPIDRLITYAVLLCLISVVNQFVNVIFCKRHFEECHFEKRFNKDLFKELFSFAGWNFIGCSAAVLRTQGATLLLNWAGGPAVNAANGIANNLCNVVNNFVGNFTQAFNPQITKRYASEEYDSLMKLLIYGSKYSYYLLFFLALPVILNIRFILFVWLGQVPEHTVMFVFWIIVFMLAEAVSRPIITAKNATGVIRNYQIIVGGILLLMLPFSYIGIKVGLPVEVVPFCNALTACMAVVARMYMLRGDFPSWSSRVFTIKVLFNVIVVSVLSGIIPIVVSVNMSDGWLRLVFTSLLCILCTSFSVLYVGCDKIERQMIIQKVSSVILRIKLKFV